MTTEQAKKPRPSDDLIAKHREAIAVARERQRRMKKEAEEEYNRARREADKQLARTIAKAREDNVGWRHVEEASGMTRQSADDLVKDNS